MKDKSKINYSHLAMGIEKSHLYKRECQVANLKCGLKRFHQNENLEKIIHHFAELNQFVMMSNAIE